MEDIEVSEEEGEEEFSSPVPEPEPVKAHISPKPPRKAPPEKEVCGFFCLFVGKFIIFS